MKRKELYKRLIDYATIVESFGCDVREVGSEIHILSKEPPQTIIILKPSFREYPWVNVHIVPFRIAAQISLSDVCQSILYLANTVRQLLRRTQAHQFDPNNFSVTLTTCKPRHHLTITCRDGKVRVDGVCDDAWAAVYALAGGTPRCRRLRDALLEGLRGGYRGENYGSRVNAHIESLVELGRIKKLLRSYTFKHNDIERSSSSYACRMTAASIRYIARKYPHLFELRRYVLPAIVFSSQIYLSILTPLDYIEGKKDVSTLKVISISQQNYIDVPLLSHVRTLIDGSVVQWWIGALAKRENGQWVALPRRILTCVLTELRQYAPRRDEPHLMELVDGLVKAFNVKGWQG